MEATSTTLKIHRFLSRIALFAITISNFEAYAQNVKTTRTKIYTKPVYFDVFTAQNNPLETQLEWDLESDQGLSLKMGPVTISEKTLSFGYRRLQDIDPKIQGNLGATPYFVINWPEYIFPEARLEILTRDGNVIWTRNILKSDFDSWQKVLRAAIKINRSTPLLAIEWGTEASKASLPFEGLADEFRFCLSRYRAESQERLCSQKYLIRKVGSQTLLGRIKSVGKPRVLLNGEAAELKGSRAIVGTIPTRFFAELATGETYDFSSRPFDVKWTDFVRLDGTDTARLEGFDTPPLGNYQAIAQQKLPKWVEKYGFEPTIGDSRKFWTYTVKDSEAWAFFPGAEGGIFKHILPLPEAPFAKVRLHLDRNTPSGTYKDGIILKGRKLPSSVVSSDQRKILESEDPNEFRWKFKATEVAKINRSYLKVSEEGRSYLGYYELYRGYANELSARSSMVISTRGLILMGEASYNHWFEDILGWENYNIAKQRWGISGRYFQSFTKFSTSDLGSTSLNVTNLDLKYRFTPGLWTRDETHGAMFSYQNVAVDLEVAKFEVPMLGIGWFWARSMPRVFDDVFNLLPFMNYPKWVDMEFIYYTGSLNSRNVLDVNFALNFHGQVLWKENFFGEAGFGIKRYAFVDKLNSYQTNLGYSLNTVYGTVGLGFKF